MYKPLCALTMGDPAGIGPEVVLRTLFSQRAAEAARMVVIGYPEPFARDASLLNMDVILNIIKDPSEMETGPSTINMIIPGKKLYIPPDYGAMHPRCGLAAGKCIELSAKLAIDGAVDAVVTAPINKESLNKGGYNYPGHTEFYQELTGAPDIAMLLTLGSLRVIHVATHTAIRDVPDLVKKERIVRVAHLMHEALILLGIEKPHIAVSGLNPHAGEAGMFGAEEISDIIPAVAELVAAGIDAVGPIPPDTVFARAYREEFDGVVAMFHDQGHIALKLIGFNLAGTGTREVGGVNTSLGLPIIRTSVDHGTAFDIAGKGIASPLSMIDAVEMAAVMARGRKQPLPSTLPAQ